LTTANNMFLDVKTLMLWLTIFKILLSIKGYQHYFPPTHETGQLLVLRFLLRTPAASPWLLARNATAFVGKVAHGDTTRHLHLRSQSIAHSARTPHVGGVLCNSRSALRWGSMWATPTKLSGSHPCSRKPTSLH
jgi:hypothetical protein